MPNAKLIIYTSGQKEERALSGVTSLGRAFDNVIHLEDPDVSRYHAIIEERPDGFWLSDLGSSNGTSVNNEPVISERQLHHGDQILLGSRSRLEFHCEEAHASPTAPEAVATDYSTEGGSDRSETKTATESAAAPSQPASVSKPSPRPIVIAVAAGLAVTIAGALLLRSLLGNGPDQIPVRIASPQSGTTIREPITVQLETSKDAGIGRIIFQLDGKEFAAVEAPPYQVRLDPQQLAARFPNLTEGDHILSITVEDKDGNQQPQADTILLAFDLGSDAATASGAESRTISPITTPATVDIPLLAQSLAAQITGKSGYLFDRQFAEQIWLRTSEYRLDVIPEAHRWRREIIRAFRDQGLHPLLGLILAMSRSRFRETDAGFSSAEPGIGLWRLPPDIARLYLTPSESESALQEQKRSAEIAAAYLKALVNVFGMDDFMYAIACYGYPLSQAGQLRTRLESVTPDPVARGNFWQMVESGLVPREAADRVIRFFAAGIVGENPQAFGLSTQRLSSLY